MIELSDKEIQSLIDARAVLNKINAHPYVINRLDKILDDIYEGWIEHIKGRIMKGEHNDTTCLQKNIR